jgi:hypothetical protein
MRNARARASLAFAIAAMLAACGDGGRAATEDGSPAPPAEAPGEPADDESAVTQTVVTYFNAIADRDYATACAQLSPEAQEDVANLAQAPGGCEETLTAAFAAYRDQDLATLRDVPVTSVTITGDTATAEIEGGRKPVPLTRSDGSWLISELVAG